MISRRIRTLCASLVVLGQPCYSEATCPGMALAHGLRSEPSSYRRLTACFLTPPRDDGDIRLRGGIIGCQGRRRQTTPFSDISARVFSGGERLLIVAFHPRYALPFFYVYYTTRASGTLAAGDIVIERFTATANPKVADPASAKLIITTPHSQQSNHNGGLLAFGLDGMLYAGLGDGGGSGDPFQTGQNQNALLGRCCGSTLLVRSVTIPPGNPFAGQAGKRARSGRRV